jgi:hypothetical protein
MARILRSVAAKGTVLSFFNTVCACAAPLSPVCLNRITEVTMKIEMLSLDEQIATLLKSPEGVPSDTIANLLKETNTAIAVAERDAHEAKAKAYDPTIIDGTARGRMEDAIYTATRLKAAVVALTAHREAAIKREEKERWLEQAAPIRQRITDLAKELVEVYPAAVTRLVDLFKRIAATDRESSALNYRAPPGVSQLSTVEGRIGRGQKIIEKVVLPMLTANGVKNIWPPQVNIGLEYSEMIAQAMRGAPPAPTEAERIAESERHIAAGQAREREKERLAVSGR